MKDDEEGNEVDLVLDESFELDLGDDTDLPSDDLVISDDGLELSLDEGTDFNLEIGDEDNISKPTELSEEGLSEDLSADLDIDLGEYSLDEEKEVESVQEEDAQASTNDLDLSFENHIEENDVDNLFADESSEPEESLTIDPIDLDNSLSADALEKMREIDEMMQKSESVSEKSEPVQFSTEEEPAIEDIINEEKDTYIPEPTVVQAVESTESLDSVDPVTENISVEMQADLDQLSKLSAVINELREEREALSRRIIELESNKQFEKSDTLTLRAELDEKKIEVMILKKRYEKQIDELRQQVETAIQRKSLVEEKNKQFEKEVLTLNQRLKVEFKKVQMRERELEDQLEMLRADADVQIRNRDNKILELKRKIDHLEFDLENLTYKEKSTILNKVELEEKMSNVINTLRSAIGSLENEDISIKTVEKLKKNLDI
jgi:hypothetical protein